ncbi:Plasmodium falciparum CPW-WPC repeat containing protein [Theileria orientalis strain Shintoku]|uniref:Plasmodium falciparum CPW-WPC repeat containing protein n=1 Tax=Theileria orientalis strain Shintoku TaxID=869250 RepID=J4D8K0_THEOR|nr:Plasmodium falciparum CPW-WPC repeat containing protein [Theileria orientalis strain Shintoku]PVC49938.1 CPW-WPC repeat containing protein [Theileria orientalis]BAM40810.1 Plasmodium falciparum CPW-WPC repeat containing protein [Theileria orientalis strain Shintoku]|eukprot:XP_009691111.1 Plasmodium falciparum CPW-WPC repeat containing protein [Theileria orientalis strain Shintoku]
MYLFRTAYILIYTCIFTVCCDSNDKFGIDIPKIHTVEEAFKLFQNEPKPENITELGTDLLRSAAEHVGEIKTISGKCVPDFSQPCPEVCRATSSYKGLCKTEASFKSFTPEQKINWSNSCQATWPCKKANKNEECSDNERNVSLYMLIFLFSIIKRVPCFSLKRYSVESCGTGWPCMRNCSFVFEECPLDWTKDSDGSCLAPPSYKGSCDRKFHFTHYTQKMKLEYLKSCDIAFECSNCCKKDYDKCPNNWKGGGNNTCTSPSYDEYCSKLYSDIVAATNNNNKASSMNRASSTQNNKLVISLNALSYDNKVLFESKCSIVNFPCAETDEYNWSSPCPLNWNLLNDYCTPLYIDEYDDCKSKKSFSSEEEKRKWSSFCQIPWPKIDGSDNSPEVVTITEAKKVNLSGPIVHETGGVNVIGDVRPKGREGPVDIDYSKKIKNTMKLQAPLNS